MAAYSRQSRWWTEAHAAHDPVLRLSLLRAHGGLCVHVTTVTDEAFCPTIDYPNLRRCARRLWRIATAVSAD